MTTEPEWTSRDELAAALFQAIVTGRLSAGEHPSVNARLLAIESFALADEFLAVRMGQADPSHSAAEPDGE
ncbi:MAG TPA: hypothetical protein VMG32_03115 [Anaeromyxobacteraceae bacterium]|nr:hypothetical protein [Anaeromyxobacteraceae bacterium]